MRDNRVVGWIVTASLLMVGATAPVIPGIGGHGAPYDTVEAERTFEFGYRAILDRTLDATTAGTTALEGLRGLSNIDPNIALTQLDGKLLLNSASNLVAEYPLPDETDVRGWARLTVTVALDARGLSESLRDADPERIYEAVFDATLARLDLFSRYSGAREARELRANRNGFGGIGIRFELADGDIRITEVMTDSPAGKAELQVGDLLTHVDGQPISGLSRDELSRRLRGPVDSRISIGIRRGYKPMDLALRRDLIVPETVTSSFQDGIATFRLSGFNKSTADTLRRDLLSLRQTHGEALSGIILDMRGNPGGFLDQAVDVADLFISDGPIIATRGRHPLSNQSYDARPGDIGEDLAVAVLMDGKAASAAEIVAAALQDSGHAVVIGTTSYGKGTVQSLIELPNQGELHLTWSRFHAPTGYPLHGLGVLPNICTAGNATDATGLVHAAATPVSGATVAAQLAQWRHSQIEDTVLRGHLRSLCQPEAHGENDKDMTVARLLISDPVLFGSALAISAPTGPSAAQIPPTERPAATGARGN
ncbi:S41 family peptidase [Magnetospirillum sulfuroxidans]|uniref:PDZ domain-containing protein n=1 Tax=Magnetospirillum sulfuroxidans TaxID=611300 RepID=A0ABS5IDX3_9PROT|nr:PDZ domain-containing protein [Magnetospirillum sulfuroxidans]